MVMLTVKLVAINASMFSLPKLSLSFSRSLFRIPLYMYLVNSDTCIYLFVQDFLFSILSSINSDVVDDCNNLKWP